MWPIIRTNTSVVRSAAKSASPIARPQIAVKPVSIEVVERLRGGRLSLLTPRYQGGHLLISDRWLHGHANLFNGKRGGRYG